MNEQTYLVCIEDDSLAPRMRRGEAMLIQPDRQPQDEDEVLVHLADGNAMVKRLAGQNDHGVALADVNTLDDTIEVELARITSMHPVAAVMAARAWRASGLPVRERLVGATA